MNSRTFLLTTALAILAAMLPAPAGELPAAEKATIESLLSHVAGLSKAKFIRNGKEYDAKSAAKFLRGKMGDQCRENRQRRELHRYGCDEILHDWQALPHSLAGRHNHALR